MIPSLPIYSEQLDFAIRMQAQKSHALNSQYYFPRMDLQFTKIPKNACSSLLQALIKEEQGFLRHWFSTNTRIHEISAHFQMSSGDLVTVNPVSGFVAVREPISRLKSAIEDKLVKADPSHGNFTTFFCHAFKVQDVTTLRLDDVLRLIDRTPAFVLNEHFAPQWDFIFDDRFDVLDVKQLRKDSQPICDRFFEIPQINTSKGNLSDVSANVTLGDLKTMWAEGYRMSEATFTDLVLNSISRGANIENDISFYRGFEF